MKKITAALLCAIMALSLAGCAASEGEPESTKRERSTKDESSYSKPESKPDESKPEESSSDSKPEESSSDSKPTESDTESKPEKPAAQKVDWSSVPVVDEMNLDYTVFEAGDINYGSYKETAREKYKELYKDGVVVITKYFGDAEYINLPDQIEGKSCILIGADVDWGDNAKAIRFSENYPFPNSTKIGTVGQGSFSIGVGKAANVTEVVMPDRTESIREFGGMPKLEIINIPNSTVNIAKDAFSGCAALKSVTIPENVEYINANAFSGCTALETVNFPAKFAGECVIRDAAFENCTSLKSIEIPEGVTEIGAVNDAYVGRVFAGCTSLTKVSLPGTVKGIGIFAFAGCTSLTEVTLSEGLETIGYRAFTGCTALSDIKLPSGLITITQEAFYGCTSLKSIDIPDSVTKIARGAFSGCEGISINYKGKTYTEKNVEKLYDKDLSKM